MHKAEGNPKKANIVKIPWKFLPTRLVKPTDRY